MSCYNPLATNRNPRGNRWIAPFAFSAMLLQISCGRVSASHPPGDHSTALTESSSPNSQNTQTNPFQSAMPNATQTEFWPDTKPIVLPQPTPKTWAAPTSLQEALESLKQMSAFLRNNEPRYVQTLTPETAIEKAKAVALFRVQIQANLEWIAALEPNKLGDPKSPEGQMLTNAIQPATDYLSTRLPKSIDQVAKHTTDSLTGTVNSHWGFIEKAATVNMKDETQVRQFLGNELTNRSRDLAIQSAIELVDAAITVDGIFNQDNGWKSKKKELRKLIGAYTKKLEKAAEAIMPPADVNDKELTKIAKEVLGRKKYGLPKYEKLIVNTKKKRGSLNEHWIDFSERTITETPKRWEEFQCATIEKDGTGFALWYNTLIFYSEGPHTVPTGKWVLSARHKSAPIAKANFSQ